MALAYSESPLAKRGKRVVGSDARVIGRNSGCFCERINYQKKIDYKKF